MQDHEKEDLIPYLIACFTIESRNACYNKDSSERVIVGYRTEYLMDEYDENFNCLKEKGWVFQEDHGLSIFEKATKSLLRTPLDVEADPVENEAMCRILTIVTDSQGALKDAQEDLEWLMKNLFNRSKSFETKMNGRYLDIRDKLFGLVEISRIKDDLNGYAKTSERTRKPNRI